MKPIRVSALTLVALALAGPVSAGQSGFAFLEVPAGARAAAMGGAYTSVARGAEAAFWNPAGLAEFEGTQFTATHTETYENLRHEQVAIAGRMFGGGLAASMRAMYSEPIPERDDLGNLVGSFGSHDLEFLLGYGATLPGGMSLGVSAQTVRERIADLAATTWAVNAGATMNVRALSNARASVSLHQMGPAAHYMIDGAQGQAVPLPTAAQAGLAFTRDLRGLTGLFALETRATRGRTSVFAMGGELDAPVGAALRFGYRLGDDNVTWSAGAGWRAGGLRVDYAFVPSRLELDDTHRFTLGASF